MVGFSLKDFTAEVLSKALNGPAVFPPADDVDAVSDVAGYRQVGVSNMGVAVTKLALLVRVNNSPYQVAGRLPAPAIPISEFWGPSCYEMSNFTTVLGSRAVSMVPFQFMCILSGCGCI